MLLAPAVVAQGSDARSEWEDIMGEPKPLAAIPATLRGVVAAKSPDLLVVNDLAGQPIELPIEWYVPAEFEQFRDGRFLGMSVKGYEDYGYILVDRAARGPGAIVATGQKPVFSPDGRLFAAAELSESGYSNLEGVALWEVREDGTIRRFFSDAFPLLSHWRVDSWPRSGCVSISAVPSDWQPPEGEEWETALPKAPRQNYSLEIDGMAVTLRNTYDQPGCPDRRSGK